MSTIFSTRKLDELGRIVLPIELRKALSLESGDSVDITLTEDGNTVSLRKYRPSCSCCQGTESLKRLPNGTYLCANCLDSLN